MKVYGIKSCDTCRKARKWLDEQGIDHDWVDLREDGVTTAAISPGPDITSWAVGFSLYLFFSG